MTKEELDKLSPEEKRSKIALACGWKRWQDHEALMANEPFKWIWTPPHDHDIRSQQDDPPDYLNDLNAMHEAEKSLSADDFYDYGYRYLPLICNYSSTFHAEASHRADAFLLTISQACKSF